MSDFKNFKNNSPSKSYGAVLLNPCFYSVLLYRISNKFYKRRLTILAKIVWFINRIIFSVDIDYRAKIGKNFHLVHGIGVVIGSNVIIGDNCKIYQGVTLGGNNNKKREVNGVIIEQPYISNNVTIYSNSMVIGPVVIGEDVTIGCMSLIDKDINSNTLVYSSSKLETKINI